MCNRVAAPFPPDDVGAKEPKTFMGIQWTLYSYLLHVLIGRVYEGNIAVAYYIDVTRRVYYTLRYFSPRTAGTLSINLVISV